jgi:hypothetical protein
VLDKTEVLRECLRRCAVQLLDGLPADERDAYIEQIEVELLSIWGRWNDENGPAGVYFCVALRLAALCMERWEETIDAFCEERGDA